MTITYEVKLITKNEKGTFTFLENHSAKVLYNGNSQEKAYEFGVNSPEKVILINKYVKGILIRQVFIDYKGELHIFFDITNELKPNKENLKEVKKYEEILAKEHQESLKLPKRSQKIIS